MLYSFRIEQAIRAAAVLHEGQVRKGKAPYPYISHPFAVSCIIADYTDDEDVIIAGLLHDTIEDTEYLPSELETDFGRRVRDIVLAVTEDGAKDIPWIERKRRYVENLTAAPQEALLVAAADKVHNMRSVIEEYHGDSEAYRKSFGGTLSERLEFHLRLGEVLNERLESHIIHEFNHVLLEYQQFISNATEKEHIEE